MNRISAPDRPIGPDQKILLQDLLEQLGVDFDPGHVGGDRRRLQIVETPGGRRADQHDVVGEQRGIEFPGEDSAAEM